MMRVADAFECAPSSTTAIFSSPRHGCGLPKQRFIRHLPDQKRADSAEAVEELLTNFNLGSQHRDGDDFGPCAQALRPRGPEIAKRPRDHRP